ncbi:MAG: hypothetical protein ABIH92_00510 [Nanoarchaeota archaeon]
MSKKTIFSILFFIVMLQSVLALGTFPGRQTIDFVPGMEKTFTFTVVNSEQRDINVVISAQGELQDYIFIPEVVVRMSASETSKEISYTVKLPQELPPGLHTADVVLVQLPDQFVDTGQMSVGAAVAVLTQVYVRVPYPGKYGEVNLNVFGPNENGEMTFAVPVFSRGEFALTGVKASVEVYTSLNEKVASVYTNEIASIPGKDRAELIANWDPQGAAPGPYRAVAKVTWGEGTESVEKEFTLGERRLTLEGVEVNDFKLGEIAKFEILVENHWSETIEGAYAEMIVYSESGNILADFKSPTYDIGPNNNELMLAFWDTQGVNEGSYDSTLFLKYAGTSDQNDLTIEVDEKKITIIGAGYIITAGVSGTGISKGLLIFLVGLIIVLALANISWFMYLRKRLAKKSSRR